MATPRTRIAVLVLALLVVSLWRAVAVEREKRQVTEAYQRAHQLVTQLAQERDHLNQELVGANHTVEAQAGDLKNLQQELKSVQQRLEETVTEIASLQREHQTLHQENAVLATELGTVKTEKQQLEAKLSSLKELRLAIHDVKRKMSTERWAAWRAQRERLKVEDQERLASGNRGYLVREGTSTLSAAGPRLHVHVLEPQSQ